MYNYVFLIIILLHSLICNLNITYENIFCILIIVCDLCDAWMGMHAFFWLVHFGKFGGGSWRACMSSVSILDIVLR